MTRLLIIDDEELVCRSLETILVQAGYEVRTARDGAEGIRLHDAEPFDLIITDIFMPGMEGLETLTSMRADKSGVPVITMSGGGHAGNLDFLQSSKLLGATEILAKPFTGDELLSLVAHVLKTHK